MPVRRYRVAGPLDLRRTLAPLARGPADRTFRFGAGRVFRASRTDDGPVSVALAQTGDEVVAEAWGPGAERALDGHPGAPRPARGAGSPPRRPPDDRPARETLPGRPDPAQRRRPRGARPGDPGAEGRRRGGPTGVCRTRPGPRRAGPGPAGVGTAPATRPVDPGRPPLLRLSPVRGGAPPRRPDPASGGTGLVVRGDRGPAAGRRLRPAPGRSGHRAVDGRRGRRSGRSATRMRSASATSTCPTWSPSRWPASRAATTPGCSSCWSRTAASGPGSSACSS